MANFRGVKKGMTLAASSDKTVRRAFEHLSKAAIFDAYCQLVALNEGHPDDPATLDEVAEDLLPTLIARGDASSINAIRKLQGFSRKVVLGQGG